MSFWDGAPSPLILCCHGNRPSAMRTQQEKEDEASPHFQDVYFILSCIVAAVHNSDVQVCDYDVLKYLNLSMYI